MTIPSRLRNDQLISEVNVATPRNTAFRRAPHVVWTTLGSETVLLDTKREKYHVLNAVATSVWEHLASGTTVDALVQGISEEFELPDGIAREHVATDVARLLATLDSDGLIVQGVDDAPMRQDGSADRHRDLTHPSEPLERSREDVLVPIEERTLSARPGAVFVCSILIMLAKVALQVVGMDRTARWISRTQRRIASQSAMDRRAMAVLEYTVAMAAALYPGRAECLERSVVLFYLLRRRGVPVSMRIGVHPDPFVAHAWVTYRGTPLNEVDEHLEHYKTVQEFT